MLNTIPRGGRLPSSLTAALAPAAVVLILSFVPAFFAAEEKPKASVADCREIHEPAGRLACFDALAKEQLPVPAKGGLAVTAPEGSR